VALVLGGCAGLSWETEKADSSFVDGTRILGEVGWAYTRDEVLAEKDPYVPGWRTKLLSIGFTDAEIVNGSEVSVHTFCYAWDMAVPCRHRGVYLAHVNPNLQGKVASRRGRLHGELVEIELRKTPSNDLAGVVVAIYRKGDDWQDCRGKNLGDMGIFKYSPSGPPNGAWIDCDGLEKEGWVQRVVRSAPSSDPNKPPLIYVHEWIKLPGVH
jgi:hypothetical protein